MSALAAAALYEQVHRASAEVRAKLEVKNTFLHINDADGMCEGDDIHHGVPPRRQLSEPAPIVRPQQTDVSAKQPHTQTTLAPLDTPYSSEVSWADSSSYKHFQTEECEQSGTEEPEVEPTGWLRQEREGCWPSWELCDADISFEAQQFGYVAASSASMSQQLPIQAGESSCFTPGPGPGFASDMALTTGAHDGQSPHASEPMPVPFMPPGAFKPYQMPSVSNIPAEMSCQPMSPCHYQEEQPKARRAQFCGNCGERSQPYFKFCKTCGTPIAILHN